MGIDYLVLEAFTNIQESIIRNILNNNKCEEEYDDLYTSVDNDLKWNQLRIDVEKYAYELFDLINKKIQHN